MSRPATFHGLHDWFEHSATHLGWMVLAKARGDQDKVIAYLNSLNRLLIAIESKMQTTVNADRRGDLQILYDNTLTLLQAVSPWLNP